MSDQLDLYEQSMSVGTIAGILGVTPEAIKKHIRVMYPRLIKNGVKTYLTQNQISEIKKKMIPTTQVVAAATDYEMIQKTAEVMAWMKLKLESVTAENAIMRPKADFYDRVTQGNDTIDLGEAAKVLNIPGMGRNNLFRFLREKGILMKSNVPYQEYLDRGYFKIVEVETGAGVKVKPVVYQKGLDYIRNRLGGDCE